MDHNDAHCREEVLLGGRLTGGVVRIGDTVRRPVKLQSLFVARLLTHLTHIGFDGAPRFLGRDEHDRDILSFIPGWVPAHFQQFENEQVWGAGQLLQRFHAATANTDLVEEGKVICHHDPGPNNVVSQDRRPRAFIDFDMAALGEPLEDIGYMAWTWCVSSRPDRSPSVCQAEQVRVLADAYGLTSLDRGKIIGAIIRQQELSIHFWKAYLVNDAGTVPTPPEEIQKRIDWTEHEIEYTKVNQTIFEQALR